MDSPLTPPGLHYYEPGDSPAQMPSSFHLGFNTLQWIIAVTLPTLLLSHPPHPTRVQTAHIDHAIPSSGDSSPHLGSDLALQVSLLHTRPPQESGSNTL